MNETDQKRGEPEIFPEKVVEGRDELNLAEFPLSAIADRLHPEKKTMVFEDKVWDTKTGEMVTRKLTITASNEYGLPTALDDEVILGLVQLSKLQGFSGRKVNFTRYQLLKVLGWRNESKSYERLEKALNRWVGVTLYYKNAWWSREEQCWVDEKFHILDNVSLYERDKRGKRTTPEQQVLPISSFLWNDVLFRSFQAGNLKSIDFDFFVALKSPITKRLYRFLDKRFYLRDRWEFDLKEFSFEHVGLSRNYDAANLKRKLRPATAELEKRGYLVPMSDSERFRKVRAGEWRVLFERARPKPLSERVPGAIPTQEKELSDIREALLSRAVTPTVADDVLSNYPLERITAQLEIFDWLAEKKDPKISRNPAGFLIASIRSEYAPPKGFLSPEEREKRARAAEQRKRKAEEQRQREQEREEAKGKAREEAIQQFWSALSTEERQRMQKEALDNADAFNRNLIARHGPLAEAARKAVLDEYALTVLSKG